MYCISKILAVTFLVGGGVCAGVCVCGGGGGRDHSSSLLLGRFSSGLMGCYEDILSVFS